MSQPFIGEVKLVGFSYAPRNYALCQGQLLAISQQNALFALLGTTYGGDGRTSFGMPDLRGRSPIGYGTGPGLYPVTWGQMGGYQTVTLTLNNLPVHNHHLHGYSGAGNRTSPSGAVLATSGAAAYSGEVPSGIPVTGTTQVRGAATPLDNGQTSESRNISGTVTTEPYAVATPDVEMGTGCIGNTGASQAFNIQSPYLGMYYVIALAGIFPPRN